MTRSRITFVIQLLIGLMLLGTGISKAFTAQQFLTSFEAYKLIPSSLAPTAAFLVILAELLVGSLLIVSLKVRWASVLALGLFLVFTVAITSAWRRGLQIDCGCFLGLPEPVGPGAVIRDLIFTLMAGWVCFESWITGKRSVTANS